MLCSDGVLEARSDDGTLFGFDRFAELAGRGDDASTIVEACCAAARDHAGTRLRDDVTVVALRWDPPPRAPSGSGGASVGAATTPASR